MLPKLDNWIPFCYYFLSLLILCLPWPKRFSIGLHPILLPREMLSGLRIQRAVLLALS